MTELECCVWLQCVFGCGSPIPSGIFVEYGSASAFCEAGGKEWRLSGMFSGPQLDRLEKTPFRNAEKIILQCERNGYEIVTISDPRIPERLRQVRNAPVVLYVQGTLPDFERRATIAMVGTREATPYGLQVAGQIATDLVHHGAIVVSGGALGIDTAAHRGALLGGGCTVAVLGCGLNTRYLMENAPLRAQIAQTGALISEYPPDTPVKSGSFPIRNRIIAGLSVGTVVVEAGARSGALITAHQALDMGRDVFAVPGSVLSRVSAGVNRLLREGAKPVGNARDILEEYELMYDISLRPTQMHRPAPAGKATPARQSVPARTTSEKSLQPRPAKTEMPASPAPVSMKMPDLSEEAGKLYRVLKTHPVSVDELAAQAGLNARTALAAITELEMLGMIAPFPGKQYALK